MNSAVAFSPELSSLLADGGRADMAPVVVAGELLDWAMTMMEPSSKAYVASRPSFQGLASKA